MVVHNREQQLAFPSFKQQIADSAMLGTVSFSKCASEGTYEGIHRNLLVNEAGNHA
jgi:hypothetical protein